MAVGFRPSMREDMQRCDDFIRGLKWFGGGTLPAGVNCERSAFSRLVALSTVAAGGAGRSAGGPNRTGRNGPLATAAPTTAPLPPIDAGTPLPLLPPALVPSAPTTPASRPPSGQPPAGGPPASDPTPPTTAPETTSTVPETTTTSTPTTTPETTSTTSDIPPEWTDPTGGGINPLSLRPAATLS